METNLNISDTLTDVKKELSSDEQMLASAFKIEKLYKKHKIKLFAIIGLAIAYFGGTAFMEMQAQNKREVANTALLLLEKDAKNAEAISTLKSNNPKLFELFSYQEAIKNTDSSVLKTLTNSSNEIIADLATYHLAVLEGKPVESKLNEDVAKVHNATLLIREGKVADAKDELDQISEESPVYNISKMIKHYSIKG